VRRLVPLLVALAATLAGCTVVPSGSSPEIVQSVGNAGPTPVAEFSPQPGAEPRAIVSGFLGSNASQDTHHLAARNFLTAEANNRWADSTVTVVDNLQVGNPDSKNRVTVTGQLVGRIDASGIYTPSQVVGTGGVLASFTYTLRRVNNQWRIDTMQPGGLLITAQQFQDVYVQRVVYFFDQDEERLVPDPRFTALRDPTLLATWLMAQLAGGARPELLTGTQSELSAQADPRRVTVSPGPPMKIEVPGSSQGKPATRDKLAAQIALTLVPAVGAGQLTITDGGRPIDIPRTSGPVFTAAPFEAAVEPANHDPELYWLNAQGRVMVRSTGEPIPGPMGSGDYHLDAVAIGKVPGAQPTRAAGTVTENGKQRLYVGTVDALHATTILHAKLSRPAWVPFRNEVWIGVGPELYRTTSQGTRPSAVPVTAAGGGKLNGDVVAVRLSPEGSRVALVVRTSDGVGQLWLGSVARANDAVQVSNLQVISPTGVSVTDIGWNDELKLFAVGSNIGTSAHIYEVQCDGSFWTARGTSNLPPGLDSITVAEGQPAAVSADDTVWKQSGSSWESPTTGTAFGTNPVYLE